MGEGFERLVKEAHPNPSPPRRGDFPKLFPELSEALFLICSPPPKSWGCDPSPGEIANEPRKLTLLQVLPFSDQDPRLASPWFISLSLSTDDRGCYFLSWYRDKRGNPWEKEDFYPLFSFPAGLRNRKSKIPLLKHIPPSFSHPGIDI